MRRRGISWRSCECAAVAAIILLAGCGDERPTVGEVIGPSGSAGSTGSAGAAGSDPSGTAGDTGSAGVTGTAGITGAAGTTGTAGTTGSAGATGTGGSGVAQSGCADLFDPGVLQTYSIDISADEFAKMDAEFHDVQAVLAAMPRETYHPVTFHFGSETVGDAAVRLKGQSSWVETVMFDPNPKMQLVIAFDQFDPHGRFHGVDKIHLDMPRSDWSFLNERLANTWFREIGLMAPCSNSARLNVNGAYYGLYAAEESKDATLVSKFFPGNAGGDLFKGGVIAETNKAAPELDTAEAALGREGHRRDRTDRRPAEHRARVGRGGRHQRRGRLLRRVTQLLRLRPGRGRIHLAAQRRRHDLRVDRALQPSVVQAAPDLLVGGPEHPAVARPALRRRDERSDLAGALRAGGGDADREVGHRRDARSRRRVVGADRDAVAEDPRKWATTAGFNMALADLRDVIIEPPAISAELRRLRAGPGGRGQGR